MIQPPCPSAARVPRARAPVAAVGGGLASSWRAEAVLSDAASVRSARCRARPLLSPGGQTAPDSERDDVVGPGSAVIGYPACPGGLLPASGMSPLRPRLVSALTVARPLPSVFLGSLPLPHPQHLSCTATLVAPAQQVPLHPSPPSAPRSPGPGSQQVLIRCINKWVDSWPLLVHVTRGLQRLRAP